jgi:hypothetical protein
MSDSEKKNKPVGKLIVTFLENRGVEVEFEGKIEPGLLRHMLPTIQLQYQRRVFKHREVELANQEKRKKEIALKKHLEEKAKEDKLTEEQKKKDIEEHKKQKEAEAKKREIALKNQLLEAERTVELEQAKSTNEEKVKAAKELLANKEELEKELSEYNKAKQLLIDDKDNPGEIDPKEADKARKIITSYENKHKDAKNDEGSSGEEKPKS